MLRSLRNSITLRPSQNRLIVTNFDDFLRQLDRDNLLAETTIVINLRGLDFIDMFSMVGLVYLCDELENGGHIVTLDVDEDRAGGFLQRAGFFHFLPPAIVGRCDVQPAHLAFAQSFFGNNRELLELTQIDSESTLAGILRKLISVLQRQLKYSRREASHIGIMLSELSHNILEHHDDTALAGGIITMQVYRNGPQRFMELVVADRGDGIRRTLQRNGKYAYLTSDTEAILLSTNARVSRYDDFTHGHGLPLLLRLAHQHGGAVHIRSGTGKIYYRMDRAECRQFTVPALAGTQFSIALPTKASVQPTQELDR